VYTILYIRINVRFILKVRMIGGFGKCI